MAPRPARCAGRWAHPFAPGADSVAARATASARPLRPKPEKVAPAMRSLRRSRRGAAACRRRARLRPRRRQLRLRRQRWARAWRRGRRGPSSCLPQSIVESPAGFRGKDTNRHPRRLPRQCSATSRRSSGRHRRRPAARRQHAVRGTGSSAGSLSRNSPGRQSISTGTCRATVRVNHLPFESAARRRAPAGRTAVGPRPGAPPAFGQVGRRAQPVHRRSVTGLQACSSSQSCSSRVGGRRTAAQPARSSRGMGAVADRDAAAMPALAASCRSCVVSPIISVRSGDAELNHQLVQHRGSGLLAVSSAVRVLSNTSRSCAAPAPRSARGGSCRWPPPASGGAPSGPQHVQRAVEQQHLVLARQVVVAVAPAQFGVALGPAGPARHGAAHHQAQGR